MKKLLKTIRDFFARMFGKKKVELSLVPKESEIPTLNNPVNIGAPQVSSPKAPKAPKAKGFDKFYNEVGGPMHRKGFSIKKISAESNKASGKVASMEEIDEACKEKGLMYRRDNIKEIAKVAWETKPKTK